MEEGAWDGFVRGAAAPPIETPYGWLLLYHAMDPHHAHVGYKVGAMLLDAHNPHIILRRSEYPLLEPTEWYEHDAKPNVVYASGAVAHKGTLYVYYGAGDKHIAVAKCDLSKLINSLKPVRARIS